MPGFPEGLKRGFETIIMGLILAIMIRAILVHFGYEELVILFNVLSIIAIIFLFDKMTYWSIFYTVGWLVGFALIAAILTPLEIILYAAVAIIVLVIKIKNKL
jgi:hypothetical protein